MSEPNLKPCPFCGGKAMMLPIESNRTYSMVKCLTCGAESGMVKISAEYSSDEIAVEKWNRRTTDDNG